MTNLKSQRQSFDRGQIKMEENEDEWEKQNTPDYSLNE